MLNLIKATVVAIFSISFLISMSPAMAQQSPQRIATHGTACQPVTLAQAIARDARWTNSGIRNPNPIGTSATKRFFVVCPLTLTDDGTPIDDSQLFIYLNYSNHNGIDQTSCTVRRFVFTNLVKTVSGVDTQAAATTGFQSFTLNDHVLDSDASFNGLNTHSSLVCLLQPGVTLVGYGFFYN